MSISHLSEVERWLDSYNTMATDFREHGLNIDFIRELRPNHDTSALGSPPLTYSTIPSPLTERAVRLCVLPLEDAADVVHSAVQVTQAIKALLPAGTQAYANAPERLHITVFHMSRPDDPRPSSMTAHDDALTAVPISSRRGPTDEEVAHELVAMRSIIEHMPPLEHLEVSSVVLADTGTLLLCSIDRRADISRLRQSLRAAFPGAPRKQTNIIHTTLLRILSPEQLPPASIAAIQNECIQWTERLRGTRLSIKKAWYIIENVFSTIEGEQTEIVFGSAAAVQ
ncbi:g7087 [Coccomyxa elongata]